MGIVVVELYSFEAQGSRAEELDPFGQAPFPPEPSRKTIKPTSIKHYYCSRDSFCRAACQGYARARHLAVRHRYRPDSQPKSPLSNAAAFEYEHRLKKDSQSLGTPLNAFLEYALRSVVLVQQNGLAFLMMRLLGR